MTEFKKGDRVRVLYRNHSEALQPGDTGVVQRAEIVGDREILDVRPDNALNAHAIVSTRVEKIDEPEPKFKTGDRLRVTVEGEFFEETDTWLGLNGVAVLKDTDGVDILNVEKVEPPKPPVEVFGPGDVVRGKRHDGVYTIGKDGYLSHLGGIWVPTPVTFTSDRYEKVNLAEVPF